MGLQTLSKTYQTNSTFDEGVNLYRFDEDLRILLFSIISNLEINLRTKLDQNITAHTNNSFWYLDPKLFKNFSAIDTCLLKLSSAFQSSKDEFAKHFKEKYFNDINFNYKHLPPFWMISELSTLGNILTFFQQLDKDQFKLSNNGNVLDALARNFGANNLKTLNGWLLCIRDLRNRCAHHSRVWNANYRSPADIQSFININITVTNRLYSILIVLKKMCDTRKVNINLKNDIELLIQKYSITNVMLNKAGFPTNWQNDNFWIT